jgi:hypothetical protein
MAVALSKGTATTSGIFFGVPVPPVTSYVTGDRRAAITISHSGILTNGAAVPSLMLDGSYVGSETTATYFLSNGLDVTGAWIKYQFASPKVVQEAKWYQDTSATHGVWKWQGSNDNSNWDDIGSSFTLGGTLQTQTSLNGNVTAYTYYRLLGVSGVCSFTPYLEEIDFKQN